MTAYSPLLPSLLFTLPQFFPACQNLDMRKEILNQKATRREFLGWCGKTGKFAIKWAVISSVIGGGCLGTSKLGEILNISKKKPLVPPERETPIPTATVAPQESPTPAPRAQYYEVKQGDNLFRIALNFGTTVEAITEANKITNSRLIYPGQILYVVSHTPSIEVVHDLLTPEQRLAADLSYEGIYYHPGELNSSPKKQEGYVHVYGLGEPLNPNYATGFPFEKEEFGCASWFFPLGTWLKVTNLANDEVVYCRVKDRGPNRVDYPYIIADLTKGARDEIAPPWVRKVHVVVEPAK